ncbi:MAG: TraR/DksA C4-type zinc finger protein [Anaerolineae bacterium]|nr:TraR/DksA C4-type zinc finger protein [Anaerolineae bacterium]
MAIPLNPRQEIEEMLRQDNLEGLLRRAGELHGHFCPYLALGVRAAHLGLKELGLPKSTGMEEIVAIIETNNCFSDGVQFVTGCTFGNNGLIFKDLGKTAVTIATRQGKGVRLSLLPDYQERFNERYPKSAALFERIVVRREEPTPEEREKMARLWAESSFAQLSIPAEELFAIQHLQVQVPPYAPIFASVQCALCGEKVMETRARIKEGQPVCLSCAGAEHYQLDGAGIKAVH